MSDLGRAHALVRYFGPNENGNLEDAHLADVLDQYEPSSAEVVAAYAKGATGACAAPANASELPRASVTNVGDVAVVVPGSGDLGAIPADAKAVAVDVRALPETPEAEGAARRALDLLLPAGTRLLDIEQRTCNGQPDEVYSLLGTPVEQYACKSTRVVGASIGSSQRDIPFAVLTADKLTPLAARIAVTLRVRADAYVIGESVPTALAESSWVGIGGSGITVRTRRLLVGAKQPVPDTIEADRRTLDPVAALAGFDFTLARPTLDGASDRPPIVGGVRPSKWGPKGTRTGDGRAALVVAYAATRTFFPYFDVVGDVIDARLDEVASTLSAAAAADRIAVGRALSRYSEALHDGHVVVVDQYASRLGGHSPLALVPAGDDLVVALSSTNDVRPGDIVVGIDGASAKSKLDEALRYVSGSPQSARARAAESLVPSGTSSVVVKDGTTGAERTVVLQNGSTQLSLFGRYDRAFGPLTELGAPDVFYVSLNGYAQQKITSADLPAIRAGMAGKRGVVLDMRGYPDSTGWQVLAEVVSAQSFGPKMLELMVTPDARSTKEEPTQTLSLWSDAKQTYTGPVVFLTEPYTQSSAEHLTSFFVSTKRGKVVGGRTSGANGTITGVQLPGGYGLTFTGMVIRNADGSAFHAHGHVPDVEVSPNPSDLRDGKDTVLLRALGELP